MTTPPPRPTIYDVAQAAGVSKSLVSLVLQGSPRVSAARRAAVEQAIEHLGYRPSRAATALAGRRIRTVGVLLDDYRNLWFVELLHGLQDALGPHGVQVAVAEAAPGTRAAESPLDGFLAMRVDGLVVAMEPTPALHAIAGLPVVVAGSRDREVAGADVAAADDRTGGRLATEHLLALGHRSLGHLTGGGGAARLRAEGFEAAATAAGVTAVVTGHGAPTTEDAGYAAAGRLLDEHPETTALFAANDTMALGALAAARDHGRRVPADLSLVGYDDSPLASTHLLDLTTVDGRNAVVGGLAARALVARLDRPGGPPGTELVQPALVLRSSTAPPGST